MNERRTDYVPNFQIKSSTKNYAMDGLLKLYLPKTWFDPIIPVNCNDISYRRWVIDTAPLLGVIVISRRSRRQFARTAVPMTMYVELSRLTIFFYHCKGPLWALTLVPLSIDIYVNDFDSSIGRAVGTRLTKGHSFEPRLKLVAIFNMLINQIVSWLPNKKTQADRLTYEHLK